MEMKKQDRGRFLLRCGQGALVGTGAILPGVSGGVLCVAFGIYEPMMALLAHPIQSFKRYYKMFIPVLIGWLGGFLLLARVVEQFFSASSSVALMLFAGLILGTVPALFKKSEQSGEGCTCGWTPFVLSLGVSFLFFRVLGQDGGMALKANVLWYLVCGLIWGLSLVVPGLSSSSILIFLGLYQPMAAGIAALDLSVILPLLAGMLITIGLTARLVNRLFEQRYALVSRIVLGIMLSSTLLILPSAFESLLSLALSLPCFAVGFGLARWMDVAQEKQKLD
ncbi:MAG: DUF368 domain-containing protein [Oscillospiraceae bacterium]|nr:DUF368 domain-containing protein [Oscillospiraceae bacterium]